jgi:hypothetical protein
MQHGPTSTLFAVGVLMLCVGTVGVYYRGGGGGGGGAAGQWHANAGTSSGTAADFPSSPLPARVRTRVESGCGGTMAIAMIYPGGSPTETAAFTREATTTLGSIARWVEPGVVRRLLVKCAEVTPTPGLLAVLRNHSVDVVSLASPCATNGYDGVFPPALWRMEGLDHVALVRAGSQLNRPITLLFCPPDDPRVGAAPLAVFVDYTRGAATPDQPAAQKQQLPFAMTPLMVIRPNVRVAVGLEAAVTSLPFINANVATTVGLVHDPTDRAVSLLEFYFFASPHQPMAGQGGGVYLQQCLVRRTAGYCPDGNPLFTLPSATPTRPSLHTVGSHQPAARPLQGKREVRPTTAMQLILMHVPRSGGRSVECTFGASSRPASFYRSRRRRPRP